ncbi:MAG: hypothetical protein E3J43_03180, partial [Candidatus Heimdallarchaeota archaeon]
MIENLPPEIISVYSLLSEEEKNYLLNNKNLSQTSKLDEIEEVLVSQFSKFLEISIAFSFLIGRILFHRGKHEKVKELYSNNPNAGLGLWYSICLIYEGNFEEFTKILETIKQELEKSIFYAFIYYIQAIEAYLVQDYQIYKENRKNCYNFYGFADAENMQESREIFKLIQIYMLELDAIYLQSTYILSLARDKTKESLNI